MIDRLSLFRIDKLRTRLFVLVKKHQIGNKNQSLMHLSSYKIGNLEHQ